jgi:hypothetical protein
MVEDLGELGRRADANLARTWVTMGRAAGGAVGGPRDCPFVASGIEEAFFNGVYATGPVADPDAVVRDAIAFMREWQVPWLLWVREGVDDALVDSGRRAGLRDAGGPPCMGLTAIPSEPVRLDGFDSELVTGQDRLEVCLDVMARGYEVPNELAHRLVTIETIAEPGIGIVMGSVDGEPVSVALVSVNGTTAGIYNVATPPEHRRRGDLGSHRGGP